MSNATQKAVDALAPVIASVARAAAERSPGLDMGDAAQITKDVSKEVAAVVVNQTNSEPWYQSTVTWTALASLIIAVYAFVYAVNKDGLPTPEVFSVHVLAIIAPLGTLYGRWVQRKPIGA